MTEESHQDRMLMSRAAEEIRQLRRRNEILDAKMEMVELFACVLHTQPAHRSDVGASPDVAWELDKRAEQIAAAGK